jgi:hypothetical protein
LQSKESSALCPSWADNYVQKIYIFYFSNKISSLGPNDSYFRALHLPPRAYTLKKNNKERGYLTFAIALIVEL